MLANPYPSFSLDPDASEQQAQFTQMDSFITSDIARMNDPDYCNQWAQKLLNLLLYDQSLQTDSNRFFQNLGAGMGITGDELRRLYDGASGKVQMDASELFTLTAKLIRGVGAPKAADGLQAMAAGGTPEEVLGRMAQAMGLTSQFQTLEANRNAGQLLL